MQEFNLHVDVHVKSDGNIFIAEVRELEGCVAFGRSEKELREKLQVASAHYLELVEDADEDTFISSTEPTVAPLARVGEPEIRLLAGDYWLERVQEVLLVVPELLEDRRDRGGQQPPTG